MRSTPLVAAISLVLSASLHSPNLHAAPAASTAADATLLDAVIVVATRSEGLLAEAPGTVSVIPRREIERTQAQDLRDLFRYEPSVTVSSSAGRFGLGDVRIRGLGGNRVQLQVDGVDVADAFSIGSFASADRDALDPAVLKQVEVLRGPASALYGSDALGGTVRFVTLDPDDLLGADANAAGRIRVGAASGDDSANLGLTAAVRTGAVGWLLHATGRRGHETATAGTVRSSDATRTAANPSDQERQALLLKSVWQPGDGQQLRATLDATRSTAMTDVLSARANTVLFGRPVRVLELRADDHKERVRTSLDGSHALGFAGVRTLRWQLHRQDSRTRQDTAEDRASGPGPATVRRERRFDFDQSETGLELSAEAQFGDTALLYGVQARRTDIAQQRDGRSVNLGTGAVSPVIFPDVFPVRDFPLSQTREWALFAQADHALFDGALRLLPALRVDHFRLRPELDAVFAGDNPGFVPVGLRARHISPKLGLVWSLSPSLGLYANAATGFRAPPYDDANLGFTNVASGYAALPNPDLKPETSRGLDVGLRGDHGALAWTVAVHATRYRDFIDSRRAIGIDPATGLLLFQSVNRTRVDLWGGEASLRLALDAFGLAGGVLRFSTTRTRGVDRTEGAWLESVDPFRAVLGVGWRGEVVGVELVASAAARRSDLAASSSGRSAFIAPGHAVLDLIVDGALSPAWRWEAGVFNLADRRVWDAADTAGVPADSLVLDRFTRPGRSARFTLTASF